MKVQSLALSVMTDIIFWMVHAIRPVRLLHQLLKAGNVKVVMNSALHVKDQQITVQNVPYITLSIHILA